MVLVWCQLGGAVSCQVYHKALALAPSARQSRSSGELVNYMQLDANKLMMCVPPCCIGKEGLTWYYMCVVGWSEVCVV